MRITITALLAFSLSCFAAAQKTSSPIQIETLSQPQITILKYTIAPHTTMKWHTHPLPNAAYILSGDLTVEKQDGTKKYFVAGQALTETVDSVHRGITGAEPAVLIVFYPGTQGLALSHVLPHQP